jgi:mevalonate kinase
MSAFFLAMNTQSAIDNRQSEIRASAPGSLMLLGEHAVLHGRRALVCAIDQRMTVSRIPLDRPILKIDSALGQYESPLDVLEDHSDFRFVLDAVRQYPQEQGIALKIHSEFSSDIGFGSSAAVTVATHAALLGTVKNKIDLFKRCLATVHRVQGRGSGSDLAASVFGGVVAYRADPFEVSPICEEFPLTAVYSGSKMKTADVIRVVEERRALNPEYYEKIFDRMDASVGEVIENFPSLGNMLIFNQKLMEEMGLCNAALAEIISMFKGAPAPSGVGGGIPAKISGSGLGDCAIGLGRFPTSGKYNQYALNVTTHGVQLH